MAKTIKTTSLRVVQDTKRPAKQPNKPHNLAYLHRDRGYRFEERDPKMIELCDLIHQSEMSVYAIANKVSQTTGGAYRVSDTTIDNWLNGKTRRPQSYTMDWVGFALGYERKWTKI